jgi:hypothetical protein
VWRSGNFPVTRSWSAGTVTCPSLFFAEAGNWVASSRRGSKKFAVPCISRIATNAFSMGSTPTLCTCAG